LGKLQARVWCLVFFLRHSVIVKQYIGAHTDLHKKIRIWREKNKPKIWICQSGTDMQTLPRAPVLDTS